MSDEPTTESTATAAPPAGGGGTNEGFIASASRPPAPPTKKRNFFRRHLALTSLLVIVLLFIGSAGSFVWYLNHELGNIQTFNVEGLKPLGGGDGGSSEAGQPLNILMLGSDDGDNVQTVADDLKDGTWTPGLHRSDTMMLVHLPADRQSAQIVSIPRDSWVPVPGYPGDIDGHAKINAAFSWGGPSLAVKTVENLTGVQINHVVMVDWNGFKGLTDALGGVRIYIPETFYDDSQKITWTKGWHTLNGEQALKYVRTRHGLTQGDFGRIERQQNYLRTMLNSLASAGTIANPIKLAKVVGTVSDFLQVDSTWSTGDIRSLALSSRHLSSGDIQFTTAPFGSYDTVGGQSIVRLDTAKTAALFRAFQHGDLAPYLKNNPGSALPGNENVN